MKATVEIEWDGTGGIWVTSPDVVNYRRRASNVQELGLAVRDLGVVANDPQRRAEDAAEKAERERSMAQRRAERKECQRAGGPVIERLSCEGHGDDLSHPWTRIWRPGRKPRFCDTHHAQRYPYVYREPQQVPDPVDSDEVGSGV